VHFLVVSRHDASPYRQAALRGELAGERGYKIGLPDRAELEVLAWSTPASLAAEEIARNQSAELGHADAL
jgi:hypothetical protein